MQLCMILQPVKSLTKCNFTVIYKLYNENDARIVRKEA